ncbi:glycosyltransferase family 2 protein [Nakamurella endophytica]|uniref:glycosyltransferase family 2 protein n=1 Tax=Nakamurella endophytica TaxID=1748367 RepID=UPI00166F3A16|nr:glycosyltransferase family 2 protein [Nakamurella endophytica]
MGTSPPGPVVVVVPTYRGRDRLESCVESLAAQDVPGLTVVVVDNASTDGSAELLDQLAAELAVPLRVLRQPVNRGFAGGVNAGITWARAAGAWAVALFNDDAVADPGWLSALVAVLAGDPAVGIVTGRLLDADGARIDSTGEAFSVWGLSYPRDRGEPASVQRPAGPVFGATGGASLYRMAMLDAVGDLAEDFWAYYEDADLSFRARLAGWQVRFEPAASARHRQGATSGSLPGFLVRQTFQNVPLLVVRDVPRGLLPAVAGRLALLYPLMLANAVRKGAGGAALQGAGRGLLLCARHGLRDRRAIQARRTVPVADVRAVMTPELPPGQHGMRALVGAVTRPARLLRGVRAGRVGRRRR